MKKLLTNKKTISLGPLLRVAQACDRCRAKKTRCDGRNPCSQCVTVGLECIVLDKLLRRAFPKGYTETLEERIRQLEAENKKLAAMLDVRDEQLELATPSVDFDPLPAPEAQLTKDNLAQLDDTRCPCGCANPLAHDRPVLLAGSVYDQAPSITGLIAGSLHDLQVSDDADDFGIAPRAFAAATAIANMNRYHELSQQQRTMQLTQLVAILSPRLTEETLFIPQLLARICQQYGYLLKPAVLAANCLALLKLAPPPRAPKQHPLPLVMNRNIVKLDDLEAVQFIYGLDLPPKVELDRLTTLYFQHWHLPIVTEAKFGPNYAVLTLILETGRCPTSSSDGYDSIEKFGALMVLVVALALMLTRTNLASLSHYDDLIREFIKPNCVVTAHCLMLLLQVLALALQYFLVVGDIATCYELRGRVITMAQQLRLHRCPAAVLGITGSAGDDMQAERRILFWCVYCLDIYASLNLGVPRLLKDFEIECAMPFTNNDEGNNVSILVINNTRLPIVGKVLKLAHAFMLYCKVLGTILDVIFSRDDHAHTQAHAVERDRLLEGWRRDLAPELRFNVDINGFSVKDSGLLLNADLIWRQYLVPQLTLIYVYFHAKILIYLPILSKYGAHHDVGLSQKEKLTKGDVGAHSVLLLGLMVQQLLIQILEVLNLFVKNAELPLLPLPLNIAQEQARFALIVAKGLLDYTKGGPLYVHAKQLLLDTLLGLAESHSGDYVLGNLTREALKLLEYAVLSILGVNIDKHKKRPISVKSSAVAAREASYDPASTSSASSSHTTLVVVPQACTNGMANTSNLLRPFTPDFDDLDAILAFDPYNTLKNPQFIKNEFGADGSFGLVPVLDDWTGFDTSHGMFSQE